jgi:hypothetical protein
LFFLISFRYCLQLIAAGGIGFLGCYSNERQKRHLFRVQIGAEHNNEQEIIEKNNSDTNTKKITFGASTFDDRNDLMKVNINNLEITPPHCVVEEVDM